ncbi:CaiB/BaiF CoA-transferase family protein [Streptomyces sp. AK08-02]|uniref:CaiB/BaiF CoA transferase family protein n=1 Tax=Streptomyces sp. AK08-02 TaxID=3028654 RepID=UPI0029AC34A0|nr:CaiB/BaiF CoA-transferase family protein [Streptomyces sp. AK08-02]MDX3753461.1 CaiB/BaiF CoA-transferase family protein [Streptomyces sp. AK08-02]
MMWNPAGAWPGLSGLRVLDLSRLLPGGFATLMMADLGADVIKIEDPRLGDYGRLVDPDAFAALNRNKRSVILDLRTEEGRADLLRLVADSEVVVESYRPGVLDAMGLGYDRLREANPRIVLCSVSGFGQSGPYARRPGHDLNFLALSGYFAVPHRTTGRVDRAGVRVADLAGAMYAAYATLVAVFAARESGEGQHLDVSLHEAAAAWSGPFALPLLERAEPVDSPLVTGDNDLFTTADGRRIALATFEDKFWVAFRQALAPEFPVLDDGSYDRRPARTRAKHEVAKVLAEVFAQRDFAWWTSVLAGLDIPWAPVYESAEEMLADPHTVERELVGTLPGSAADRPRRQVRFPVRFGAGLDSLRGAAPAHGEHTAEVLEG